MKALQVIFQKLRSFRLSFLFILFVLFMMMKYFMSFTTPIILAIEYGSFDTVRYLISKDFDVNAVNTRGEPINSLSASLFMDNRENDLFKFLIESGANPDMDDTYNYMPMIMSMTKYENIGLLKLLISKGANLDSLSQYGKSALHLATEKNNIQIMKILIDAGANVDTKNHKGNTALFTEVNKEQIEGIKLLLASGANPNVSSDITLTKAVRLENIEVTKLLLNSGADVNRQNGLGWSVMHLAAHLLEKNKRTLYELLLKHNPDMNLQNYKKQTPFMIAVKYDTSDSISKLIKQGADINVEDEDLNTPLLYAAKYGNADVVKLLINKGANINAKNKKYGSTALIYMVENGDSESVDFLLKKGADANTKNNKGNTALINVSKLDESTRKRLIKKTEDVNTLDEKNVTILMRAAANGDIDLVRTLVKRGADLNAKDNNGNTLLMYAAKNSSRKIVEFFLINDVDINIKNLDGYSALMFASEYASADVVKALVENGADVHVQDIYDRTPLSLSVRNKDKDVPKILIQNGAMVNIKRIAPGMSPKQQAAISGNMAVIRGYMAKNTTMLMKAAKLGNSEMVEVLLKKGSDVNATSKFNNISSLQYAIKSGDVKSVKLLLEYGADININYDAYGKEERVLINVIRVKKLEIAKLLIEHGIELDMMDSNHYSAMSYAINEGYVMVVKALLEKGANIKPDDVYGFSPLSFAIRSRNIETIILLLDAKAKMPSWSTAMLFGVKTNDINVVKLLIKRGFDVNDINSDGQGALLYAAYDGNEKMIDLLIEHGAKIEDDYTGLVIAIIKHDIQKVKLYSQNKDTLHWSENESQGVLQKAIRRNQTEVVKILLEAGAHVESRDQDGRSPLSMALGYQNPKIIKLLIEAGANANYQHKWGYKLLDNNNTKEIEAMLKKAGAK